MTQINKDDNFQQFKNEGVISFENLFSEEELKDLTYDFEDTKDDFEDTKEKNFSVRLGEKKFEPLREKLLHYLKKKNLYHLFERYFGKDFVCYVAQYTQTKFENNSVTDYQLVNEGAVTAFHHDNIGNRLKFNILLSDIAENENGLDYALKSHFPSNIDKFLVKFLNLFGLFKNFEKELLRYLKRKYIDRKKYNFCEEKKIYKKYKVKKIFGKRGLSYIFDTNGFHRRAIPDKGLIGERKLLTYYFLSKKKFDYFLKDNYSQRFNQSNIADKDKINNKF